MIKLVRRWLDRRYRIIDRRGNARGVRGKPNVSGPILVSDEELPHARKHGWLVTDGPTPIGAGWSWIARPVDGSPMI